MRGFNWDVRFSCRGICAACSYVQMFIIFVIDLFFVFFINKGHTRDAGPGFTYSCRKYFLLTNNQTRVSGFF